MLKIEVLGPGCVKCDNTFEKVKQAVEELKLEAELIKVIDVFQIIDRGVSSTPALVINGKLVFQGEELSQEQIKEILNRQISTKEEIS